MSNAKPLGKQVLPEKNSFSVIDFQSPTRSPIATIALSLQLLLAMGGAFYLVFNLNWLWLGLPGALAWVAGLGLRGLSRDPALIAQLRQQGGDRPQAQTDDSASKSTSDQASKSASEIAHLTAVNQALRDQLNHQATLQDQLHQAEAAALQSEKMATLGLLMAGVAHEINTPLGAIQASAENLDFSLAQLLSELPQLCRCLDEAQLIAFAQLLSWSSQNKGHRSSREERQLKRELTAQLDGLNIDNARSIAAIFSPMGITQDLTPLLPILTSPDTDLILDAAYHFNAIRDNGSNIGIAISRANKIVASLRNYARKGSQAQPTLSDLRTGLDTVLTLYQNKLKHGVEVQKHYDNVPPLLCCPEELEQAWANLIGNAIQAMEGQGKLDISLTQREGQLVVTITDSGPGIPEAVQDQIFAPYFTTKPMGEGSGLGLSITEKIIQRHCGSIELDSQPGQTRFRIYLPLAVPHDPDDGAARKQSSGSSASIPSELRVSTVT